jgi:hypothetical protein
MALDNLAALPGKNNLKNKKDFTMKNTIKAITLSFITTLTACSGINSVAPFDKEQAKILLKQSSISTPARQGVIISPRPTPDERRHIDTELVGYSMEPDASADLIAKQALKDATENCVQADTKIMTANRQFSVYQYSASECKNDRPRFLIGKAFNGDDGVYVVTFSGNHLDAAEIKRGTAIIHSATLVYSGRNK